MLKRRVELTDVENLIEELKKLPPKTKVYASGANGYMHIGTDMHRDDCVTFDYDELNEEYENEHIPYQRYESVLGFNTKQWWAYDNITDEYCDPPTEVLDAIKNHSTNVDTQEDFFNEILSTEPDWLNDKEHRYDDIDI